MSQDQIKKILIISSGRGNLEPIEVFLRNRDWTVKVTSNLKEALIFLVQEQPPFVMVSVDHPNKKVRNFPKILTQAFPVCVIAFTEDSSASGFAVLSNSATEYLIYPPVTGPAVLRTVSKYHKDQQSAGSEGKVRRPGSSTDGDSGVIAIRGSGTGFDVNNSQNLLGSLLGEDAFGVISQNSNQNASGAGYTSHPQQSTPNIAMIPNSPGLVNSGDQSSLGTTSALGESPVSPNGSQNGPMTATQKGPSNKPMSATEDGAGMGTAHATEPSSRDQNKDQNWVPVRANKKHKQNRYSPEELDTHPQATKKDTLISKGAKVSLDESVTITPYLESTELGHTTHVACLIIESKSFSGYLITAMGHERRLDKKFLRQIRDRLYKFLKESGEELSDKEQMKLRIRQVPFEGWALERAEFLRKSVHNGHEVAMAFFPRQDLQGQVGSSAAEEMATIRLSEIMSDKPLEFNAYVYLPKNDKYVLYTPRGAVFYGVQKERLQKNGIHNLHVFKDDLDDVTRYRAQNYLNDSISEYEEEQNKLRQVNENVAPSITPQAPPDANSAEAIPTSSKIDPSKKSA